MRRKFGLRVAVFDGSGGEAELAYDCGFNALVLRRLIEEELDAARAFGIRAHVVTACADRADEFDSCWSGPVSALPESSTAALLAEESARPLDGLDYVIDARPLAPEETLRAASAVGCPYAPLLARRGKDAFFPRVRRLDSQIDALSGSGIEAAAVELGPLDDPAEVVSACFAGLKLASPDLARADAFSQAIEMAFRPRTRAAGRALEGLFERAEDALGGLDGIDGLDAARLARYIGRMKPLAVAPGRLARECAEVERVRSIARYAARAIELAKSRLAAEHRACGRAGRE